MTSTNVRLLSRICSLHFMFVSESTAQIEVVAMFPRYLVDFNLQQLPHVRTDVIVIGAGIAGLFTAIKASDTKKVIMITKKSMLDSNTRYSQGGVAAVISDEDSPVYHMQDTLVAGAGLCDEQAVNVLVQEGPDGVKDLIRMGTQFDIENGELALTKEGAHSHRRILHANGDATGAEIVRSLSERTKQDPNIELWDDHYVIDLITRDGECCGALMLRSRTGNAYSWKRTRRFYAPGERASCTGIRRIPTSPQGTASPSRFVLVRKSGTSNSFSSIRRHCVTQAHRGFLFPRLFVGKGRGDFAEHQRRAIYGKISFAAGVGPSRCRCPCGPNRDGRDEGLRTFTSILRMNPKN